jgi:hypothetical protein
MKRKPIYITCLVLVVITFSYKIVARIIKYSHFEGKLSSGYSFRLVIGWPEQIMLLVLIIATVYLVRKIRIAGKLSSAKDN